jgi:imidazolonepropionase-like amidohydrolase
MIFLKIFLLAYIVSADQLLIKNAQIVNPEEQTIVAGDIFIENGIIKKIFKGGESAPEKINGQTINVNKMWVVPGFIDMHVHSWGNPSPSSNEKKYPDQEVGHEKSSRAMLYAGVTAFLNLGADDKEIFEVRKKQRDHKFIGADFFIAGRPFGFWNSKNSKMAKIEVDKFSKLNPDVMKIILDSTSDKQTISKDTFKTLVEEGKARHLKIIVHIGSWKDAKMAVDAGVDAITHLYEEEDLPNELLKIMKEKNVYFIPTMAV